MKFRPVCIQAIFTARVTSPLRAGPQWAAVSPSKKPGATSILSAASRILADGRSNGESLAVDLTLVWSLAFAGLSQRSIDAALITDRSFCTSGL